MKKLVLMLGLPFLFLACNDDDADVVLPPQFELNDQFNGDKRGWTAGFSDHPVKMDTDWKLEEGIANLPAPLDTQKKGFRISGNNHSDDLFMYFKKKMAGLKPNTEYTAAFALEFASDAPSEGWAGVGGAPNAVSVGIGVVPVEPKSTVDNLDHYRMNIDKIQQKNDGKDMKVIGDIGNGTDKVGYKLLTKTGEFKGKTDANGNLWLIFGTDSGFEATTTLYYTSVKVKLTEGAAVK
ncbi:hypothetical protein GCM10010967_54490 [Dyadobacter beijingensis]|uniref:Lipoprotein n=1 Tax=Dyadobacter beijingensis TaxID=365489 RepID=A0ABQ2IL89_9BACT|nr:hypothetical protein [Dyadobacter beijingensis]GGN11647.1 hypothetical protein GCM10010967_54490 [Dyadobacter beijingensis]